ncbi:MAG TPA: amidase [Candidatus Udaeobacter sp.]|nr:amidase [Candidatus Udaeobacter sp.]
MNSSTITVAQSNAFVTTFDLSPTGSGPLDGLRFAVKDTIDVAGFKTGCGNPTWRDSHPVAVVHAVCVEQLLRAGASCAGKTICDELAFSLLGENHFYGTPLNAHAPDRVPGGSSSGSASAVACGLVDFALGTDTGGSARVPASNCGIWGFRPSHDFISVAGVNPLAPSFDTVGVLARSANLLTKVGFVLLTAPVSPSKPAKIYLIRDAFALADPDVQEALSKPLRRLREIFGDIVRESLMQELLPDDAGHSFASWADTFCVIQWAEIKNSLGAWMANAKPELGPEIAASFELVNRLDRRRIAEAVQRREQYFRSLHEFLGPDDLLCIPTTPALAPTKRDPPSRSSSGSGYYPRLLSLTSLAGMCRLPQVSLPIADVEGIPVGLSLLARHGQDSFLLQVAETVEAQICG